MNLVIEVSFTEDTGIYVSAEDQKIQFIENLVAKSPDGSYRVPENFMNEVDKQPLGRKIKRFCLLHR